MKHKQKAIQLDKAKLQAHPLLGELIKNDLVNLKVNHCIGELSIEVIQTILDLHPLPVTLSTDGDCYLTLASSGILERFKAHPLSKKLTLKVLIYPADAVEHMLSVTLLYNCAVTLYLKNCLGANIQQRHACFKAHGIHAPKKTILANLANTSPSAFR
ncbi:hypothetical protein PTRA_a0460 [Pseudoalteromonas translucida KMM 520]|uniref:Uncharacterized protein n=1 Tax=Pseudoalteromonas translucida KMM 520 TaxID=1315283 RepID=A0A0U2WU38_9GAMM|nr:hypothetical protein [Pseudoalteromonas translucida]ALS31816.1 hypothetical protein PTRA_a0460 [Pseudoalteromonas translucida KMM 520]